MQSKKGGGADNQRKDKTGMSSGKVMKSNKGLRNSLASLGVVTALSLGGLGVYHTLGADATELEVTYLDNEDGETVEVEGSIPVIQYLVVGGEPRDIEYERTDTKDRVSYYINNSDEEVEIKGIKDVTESNLDVLYSEVSDDISVNSVVDYGNIGVHGTELTQTSEDLINLKVTGDVTEHLAEYDSETGKYTLVSERDKGIPTKDIKDKDYALIAFIDKFEPVETEVEEAPEEDTEEETEEETEEQSKETETEGNEDTSTEDVEEDTESDEGEEIEPEEDKEPKEDEEPKEEPKEESKPEITGDVVDVSKKAGTETLLGEAFVVGKSPNNPNESGLTLFVTPEQLEFFVENVNKPLNEHKFYIDNKIESVQDLYNKFGLYNISESIEWLYVEELDENGDGVMGNVPNREEINWVEIQENYREDMATGGPTGEGGLGEGQPTIEDEKEGLEDYDQDREENLGENPDGVIIGGGEDVYNPDDLNDTEESLDEGDDTEVDIGDVEYGEVEDEYFGEDGEVVIGEETGGTDSGTDTGSSTAPIEEVEIDLGRTETNNGLEVIFDESGRISEVYNSNGDRIAYRDANGNLIYDIPMTHPDRVEFENSLSNGEVVVKDGNGNTARVDKDGNILPDTGVADTNNVIPIAVSVIALGIAVVSVAMFRRRKDVEEK